MGRASLGAAARTVTISMKLSAREVTYLERRFGTVRKGLRAAVDQVMPASASVTVKAGTKVAVLHEEPSLLRECSGPHAYRTVPPEQGDATLTQTCRNCGHSRTIERP